MDSLYASYMTASDSSIAAVQRLIERSLQSPFIKEQLQSCSVVDAKTCLRYVNVMTPMRDELVQKNSNMYPQEAIDREISRYIETQHPMFGNVFRNIGEPLMAPILSKLSGKVDNIVRNLELHRDKDKAVEEVKQLMSKKSTLVKGKELVGKLTSLWNKSVKNEETPEVEPPTYKQQLVNDFIEKFRAEIKSKFGAKDLKTCFFQLQIDQISNQIDEQFEDALHRIQHGVSKLQVKQPLWTPYSTGDVGGMTKEEMSYKKEYVPMSQQQKKPQESSYNFQDQIQNQIQESAYQAASNHAQFL